MRKLLSTVVVAAALLSVPSQAEAGFTMGFRLGLGFPGGELEDGLDLGDDVELAVPFLFQLGGAFAQDRMSVEGFFELSPMVLTDEVSDGCELLGAGADCAAAGLRIGALFSYRFMPERSTPWVGGALAWETLTETVEDSFVGDADWTYSGYNVELMGGYDFKLGRVFALGPYASFQFGEFTDLSGDLDYDPNAGMHTWLQLGVRGRFDF